MYTNEQIQKDREYTRNLLKDLSSRNNDMWLVVCIWRSPVDGSLEHRQGWFLDFVEADQFRNMLDGTCRKLLGVDYQTYCFHTDKEIIEAVLDSLI